MSPFAPATPRQTSAAMLVLRVVLGIIFMAHGGQKLFVYGFDGVAGAFAGMGIPLASIAGPAVALVEFFGGLALVAGLLTRLAGVGLAVTMLGAIFFAHLSSGFFAPEGYEFPLALLAGALAVAIAGAGDLSADALIARRQSR